MLLSIYKISWVVYRRTDDPGRRDDEKHSRIHPNRESNLSFAAGLPQELLASNVEVISPSVFRLVMPDQNAYADVLWSMRDWNEKSLDPVANCYDGRRSSHLSICTGPMCSDDLLPFKFSASPQFASFSPSSTSACSSSPPTVITFMRADSRAGLHLRAVIVPKLQALYQLPLDLASALVADVVHGAHV